MSQWIKSIKMISICLVGLLSLLSSGFTQAQDAIALEDKSCAQSSDKFESTFRMTDVSKKYSGQCLDAEKFRNIKNLSIVSDKVSLNNYHHRNQFWQAKFSLAPDNIESAVFQIVRFPILGIVEAAHIQIRFKLKAAVELKSQTNGDIDTNNDVLISFEAARPKGEAYNFALGALPNYALVGRVASTDQKDLEGDSTFEQYELDLTADERSALLKLSLEHSHQLAMNYSYNTLRPNCTTEVLDLIDQLPRFKGKHAKFMTVISNDPVAQPSIDALKIRGVIKNRIQSYQDEKKGIVQILSTPNKKTIPLLPQVQGLPWSLVFTLPNTDGLTVLEKKAVLKIRAELLNSIPLLIQSLGSSFMQEAGAQSTSLLTQAFEKLQIQIKKSLVSLKKDLPRNKLSLGLYFVPFEAKATGTDLSPIGVEVVLPFNIVNLVQGKNNDMYYFIAEGARKAADAGSAGKLPAYMMALGLKLNFSQSSSDSYVQILIGLKDQAHEFKMKNSQIHFQQAIVNGNQQRLTRPVVLMSHHQDAQKATNPLIQIEFGAEGGLAGTMAGDAFATFQIRKDLNDNCEVQAQSAPKLIGKLSDQAIGKPILDKFIKGKDVSFYILAAELNAQTLEVSDMDVRISTWPVNCLSLDKVNQQFQDNANQMLNKFKNDVKDESFIHSLLSKFLKAN